MKSQNVIAIPINQGTLPDYETRLGFPLIRNEFVGTSGNLYNSPGLLSFSKIEDSRAFHYTPFNGGSYIVVSNNHVFGITKTGEISVISFIVYSQSSVQITENSNYEITIVDGISGYVFDQKNAKFIKLTNDNGMLIDNPISCVTLNTFTIILGKDGTWQISKPDQAKVYDPLQIQKIESILTEGRGVEVLNNNLYIIGESAIERWIPTFNVNTYLFPFERDSNFIKNYGALSTGSICRGYNKVYFLSSTYMPMQLTSSDVTPIASNGIAKIISKYKDVNLCSSSFYSFQGNDFYHLSFISEKIAWVYCDNSKKWALNDDLILDGLKNIPMVLLKDGVYNLSDEIFYTRKREIITPRIVEYKGQHTNRMKIYGIELKMIQGLNQLPGAGEPEFIELTLSTDSETWGNTVRIPLPLTGVRQGLAIWKMRISCKEITAKITYYGKLKFTVEKLTMKVI